MARQITIRNPTPELTRRLKAVAEARGESLNTTVLRLLAEAVGFEERRERLERWATWNEEDAAEFDAALRAQRIVDEQLWR
jgi:hypothetical protein